jgi:hypothetical protein
MLALVKIRSVNTIRSAPWHMPILNALVDQKERSTIHGHTKTKMVKHLRKVLLTNRYELVSILLLFVIICMNGTSNCGVLLEKADAIL